MAFPASLPSYTITAGSETANGAGGGTGLSGLLNAFEVDITALGAKLGTGASTPISGRVLRGNGVGTSAWAQIVFATDMAAFTSADIAGVISDETGTGALVFANSPTIVTPTVASFTNAQHSHANAAGGGQLSGAAALTAASVDSTRINFGGLGAGVWWEEIGRGTLLSNGTSISVTGIPARAYLKIMQFTQGTGGVATTERFQFNGDTGANYEYRRSIASTAQGLVTGQTGIDTFGDINAESWGEYIIYNNASLNKPILGHRMVLYPNGGSGNTWVDLSGGWRNASAAINRIDYLTTTGTFATGSEIVILGHN